MKHQYFLCRKHVKRRALAFSLMVGLLFIWSSPDALYAQDDEYAVKAALVYKISRFVTWPDDTVASHDGLTVCVVGKSLFSNYLDALQENTSLQSPVEVLYLKKQSKILEQCHIAFISKSETDIYASRLKFTDHMPVLMISDIHGFAKAGGTVEIVRRNNRLGFIFNMQKVKASGLTIAAPLLQMSMRIEEVGDE